MNKAKTQIKADLPLDTDITKKSALVLRALNNSFRQRIIKVIQKQKRINVTDLYKRLHLGQSVVSQHLAILRNHGFVIAERVGKEIYYSLNYERFAEVDRLVKMIV